jgi:D-ribitol-5-phosphate cytidylyltransferase
MNTVGIVLASGSGQRFDVKDVPKHLTLILEIPIIIWTLDSIIKSKIFSSVVVVTRDEDVLKTKKIINKYFPDDVTFIRVTTGSSERIQSFFLGLDDLSSANLLEKKTIIGLFDANRPFTPISQLEELYKAVLEFGCSCPVRPVVNGIAQIDSGRIVGVPEKSKYAEYVTPEFIQFDMLNTAIEVSGKTFSSLVEYALDSKVEPAICSASILNSKLTFPEDKTYLEGLAIDKDLLSYLLIN